MTAAPQHARVEHGTVVVMSDGRWQADNWLAWSEWLIAMASPLPATQARAREIRAALDDVAYPQERIAA